MKILVDEMPKQPEDCCFSRWDCEYGWRCRIEPLICSLEKKTDCEFLAEHPEERGQ